VALESESTWVSEFANLPNVSDDSWIDNLLDYLEDRINSNLKLIDYFPESGNSFTLNRAIIRTSIEQSTNETGDLINTLATGIKNSVLQSGSLDVQPGSYIAISSPATTFSSVSDSVIDPPSSISLENKILELLNSEPVGDANDSDFPVKIRSAFLLLTAIIVGTNSVAPTPSPILDIGRGLE
jgi:hypothetical protein